MDVAPDVLTDDELYQLGALDAFCRLAGDRVRYVNPHEAHYNTVVEDPVRAGAVVRPVAEASPALPCRARPSARSPPRCPRGTYAGTGCAPPPPRTWPQV